MENRNTGRTRIHREQEYMKNRITENTGIQGERYMENRNTEDTETQGEQEYRENKNTENTVIQGEQ